MTFIMAIIYKQLSTDDNNDLKRQIHIAYKLSGEKLTCKSLCEQLWIPSQNTKKHTDDTPGQPAYGFRSVPSGSYILPKHRINLAR